MLINYYIDNSPKADNMYSIRLFGLLNVSVYNHFLIIFIGKHIITQVQLK